MDIYAKHCEPDKNGVRIAELDEMSYRRILWDHRPLTDFWRVGRGIGKRLESVGIYTMGDIAKCSIGSDTEFYNENLLYKLFGINAELLIDHAWGWEPCTIEDVKSYKPDTKSISSGQVLTRPYSFDETAVIVREMAELLALDLVDKKVTTNQIVLTLNYDTENIKKGYKGEITVDGYGRKIPKHAHGTSNINRQMKIRRNPTMFNLICLPIIPKSKPRRTLSKKSEACKMQCCVFKNAMAKTQF